LELHNSLTISKYIYLKTTHSTNEYASNCISKNNPKANYCIYTFNQTQGKGQIGRFWYTGKDNNLALTLSIAHVNLKAEDQFLLNIATSLAVLSLLMDIFPEEKTCIKWPNDIYIDEKKIAGILIQNQLSKDNIVRSIIGVGLNVNQEKFETDIPNPVSMFNIDLQKRNLIEVKSKLEEKLLSFLSKMQLAKKMQRNIYLEHLYRKNEVHQYEFKDQIEQAEICDVNDAGKLVMKVKDQMRSFNFREVKFII